MGMVRTALVLVLAGLLPLTACSEDEPGDDSAPDSPPTSSRSSRAPQGDVLEGRLMFSRFEEATHTFISTHTANPDGGDETEIPLPGPEGGGRWSESGTLIAVMTILPDDRIGTAIINPDGSVDRVLEIPDDTLNLVCTVWSPDDSRLACEGWDETAPGRDGIYSVRAADGGELVRLTDPPPDETDFPGDYSPGGRHLVFKRGVGESGGTLLTVGATGGEPHPLETDPAEDPGRYSPDGRTILTSSGGRILIVNKSGRVLQEIAETGAFLFGAVWSPDGTHIAFSEAKSGPFADVYTSLPNGEDKRQVTSTPENEIVVEWGRAAG